MTRVGVQRLHPVCTASGRQLNAFFGAERKGADGRVPCPVCGKVVKLRKGRLDRSWSNTIPHHHKP